VFQNNRKNLVYLCIFLVPFVLFFSRTSVFKSIKYSLVDLTVKPAQFLSLPFLELKKLIFYHRTYDAYIEKRKEVQRLKSRLVGLEEVIRENSRLQSLLEFKRKVIYSQVVANVVGRDPSRWNATVIIDKGEADGLKMGMPVVNDGGVIGKIMEVAQSKSKVLLLIDPQFSVAALIQEPRETGVVSGTLKGLVRMRFINRDAHIQIGDRVITSKLSSSFPESLMIGKVVRVRGSSQGLSQECLIQPAVSFSQLEEVLVIVN